MNFDQNYFYYLRDTFTMDLTAKSVDVKLRIAFRDADNNVIESLSQNTFHVEVRGTNEESACKTAKLNFVAGAENISLSFDGVADEQMKDLEIRNAFKVEMIGGDETCGIEYKLYTQDPTNQEWYSWNVMNERFLALTGSYINSWAYLSLDDYSTTGSEVKFGAAFSQSDVAILRSYYVD